jgi:mono/diheme cytochrome c family protein
LNAEQQAIRLECNLCHSIPVVAGPNDYVSEIEISRGPEPQSHLNPNWISLHRSAYNATCSDCHTTDDPGGTSNSSFCSNSACHGSAWTYAGFDAPALREILQAQLPAAAPTAVVPPPSGEITWESVIGPLLLGRCGACHGEGGSQGLNLTTYETALAGSANGPVIVPRDPEASLLIQKQSAEEPHFGQLTPEELETMIAWIEAGAPE